MPKFDNESHPREERLTFAGGDLKKALSRSRIKSGMVLAIILALGILFFNFKTSLAPILTPKKTTNTPTTTSIFFAGDIMLSRNVARKMYEADDFALPFKKVADFIKNADISFANLESPFNDTGNHSIEGSLIFNADPKAVEGLKSAGFDLLSTANNHALDQGAKGVDYTLNLLKQNGILPVGTFYSADPAWDASQNVIVKNKIAFGFLSYSYTALNDGGKSTSPMVSDFNDLAKLKQDIQTLRGHFSDVVIVNMHAGTEYTSSPSKKQIDFAHAAIDFGADLVVGEHPHWIQTIEQYQGKWIFYSLGNFVFDQMWSTQTREGLTLLVTYEHEHIPDPENQTAGEDKLTISKIELKPVIIDDYCCPRWADLAETSAILTRLGLTSPILMDKND